jgi:hypothetical protein
MEHHAHHGISLFYISCGIVILCAVGFNRYITRQMSKAQGIYPMRQAGNVMQFRKPLALRRAELALFWLMVLTAFGTVATAQNWRNAFIIDGNGIFLLSLSAIVLYLSGPDDVRLDGKQRAYERTVGWLWKPATRIGSFNGIRGICISPQNSVLLLMEKPDFVKSTNGIVLSCFRESQPARALAEEMNRMYGFPIVPYPKT